ncbi:uncharacterized protein LOC113005209 [Solenopsis invicta]|uniref:uncharacterized protein LOC113005209 n=1 Tax=Solenopsis invicta TaxID=13686 RepID=UPI00193DF774|nr:uncharacterized protein LOC113005209 [Solenopsis invicta]
MTEHMARQITVLQTIERVLANFKKIGRNNYTATKIRQRMTMLKESWAECRENHAILMQTIPEEKRANISYFKDAKFNLHQEVYEETLDYMADCLEELEPAPSASSCNPLQSISSVDRSSFSLTHLPPIKLPPFSGTLDEWENFRDRFNYLIIQNKDLTQFSRMHFLASSLTGHALDTIKSIPITAANFEIAWKTLVSRYDNKRRLVEVHVSALFDLPTTTRESAIELNKLRDEANRSIASLKELNRSPKAWRLKTGEDPQIPQYEALYRFLEMRVRALEELAPAKTEKKRLQKISSVSTTVSKLMCPLCQAAHFMSKCPQFMKKTPSQRNSNSATALNVTLEKRESSSTTTLCSTAAAPACKNVLLATARVTVLSPSGRTLNVRALFDQGSEITFVTERLAQNLRLPQFRIPLSISAVGAVYAGTCRFATPLRIAPINHNNTPLITTAASILSALTKYSPLPAPPQCDLSYLQGLDLADPTPVSAEPIELILGADLYPELFLDGVRRGKSGQPIAQEAIFGWVLTGPTSNSGLPHRSTTVQHCASADNLDRELRLFWEFEEVPRRALFSPEKQQCENHFSTTHSRDADGRYVVRLPFRRGPPIDIGESRAVAERFLSGLHRRLRSNSALTSEYDDLLRKYEALGHMRKVTDSTNSAQHVYIPHHLVIRDTSVTTRLRVIFNAFSRTTNSTSLNDHLLAGPKLQTELPAVILRWRQFRYVYAADIAKMYRQICVDSHNIDFQRILWSASNFDSVQAYQLTTVTYGTACAPFLALRVLKQLVQDEGSSFPLAAPILQENICVDDVLFGADDIPLLRQTREQVCALLGRGRFELRKWASNSASLLTDITLDNHGLACDRTLHVDESLKILGISWSPVSDTFKFTVAPIKSLSIPRLELCAAVLLARSLEFVRTTLDLAASPCYCWTDSTVVLAWITQQPAKWKTFVEQTELSSRTYCGQYIGFRVNKPDYVAVFMCIMPGCRACFATG